MREIEGKKKWERHEREREREGKKKKKLIYLTTIIEKKCKGILVW